MDMKEFRHFLAGHRESHPEARLPEFEAATAKYQSWFKILLGRGINDVGALEHASTRLHTEPPKSHADHFPTLCRYAQDAMKSRGGVVSRDISTREGAEHASKGCERCSGSGLTTVYHPRPSREARIAPTSGAYCVCAMGRWIERTHRAKSPDIRQRIPDLKDVLEGRGEWMAAPMTEAVW